jgi:glycosyltransferase involved in cell wall biosynthesis
MSAPSPKSHEAAAGPLRVLNLCTQFAGLGGVESVVRDHHRNDAAQGLDSRFCVFWEPSQPGWDHARFLDFSDALTIRTARRRFRDGIAGFDPQLVVWHTVWGWPYFDDLAGSSAARVLFLHSDTPGLAAQLATRAWWADGFACVNDRLVQRVRDARPDIAPERIHRVHYPVDPPIPLPSSDREVGDPLVIGFCGRLDFEQKRVDRIPELVEQLGRSGIRFRMEFLGDGPQCGWLQERLTDSSRFVFHGRKSGREYWGTLSSWDALFFVSDYEGTPIALLEAMTCGVVPLHPGIGSGGDQYSAQVDPTLVYPAGDIAALASRLVQLSREGGSIRKLRARSTEVVAGHAAHRYREVMAEFQRRIAHLPRLDKRPLTGRPFPTDWLSFGAIRRLMDWKRRRGQTVSAAPPSPR